MRTDLPQSLLWGTVYCSEAAGAAGQRRAAAHIAAFLRGQLDTSLLQQQQEHRAAARALGSGEDSGGEVGGEGGSDADDDLAVDEYLLPPAMRRHWQPLLTFVTMPELPRGCVAGRCWARAPRVPAAG